MHELEAALNTTPPRPNGVRLLWARCDQGWVCHAVVGQLLPSFKHLQVHVCMKLLLNIAAVNLPHEENCSRGMNVDCWSLCRGYESLRRQLSNSSTALKRLDPETTGNHWCASRE
jgi:hypothetical protein